MENDTDLGLNQKEQSLVEKSKKHNKSKKDHDSGVDHTD